MGILTIGELLMSPTMLALTAKRAPADARGRYMSIYNLSHPIGNAFGPALAGLLYDQFYPAIDLVQCRFLLSDRRNRVFGALPEE